MVTQCDWRWYLDVGLSLITCYNKSTRTAVYQYDSAHCIQQRIHITHTYWLCIVGRYYNKNQNFCGDESISREIRSTQNQISWKRVNTKTKSREIGSTQKRNLVQSGQHKNEISWNRVNIVKSGPRKNHISWNMVNTKTKSNEIGSTQKRNFVKSSQNKNEISWNWVNIVKPGHGKNHIPWNRVNTKTISREIWSTQKRNLVKSGQPKNEISRNHVIARFSIHYTIC